MTYIAANCQWLMKEDVFSLLRSHLVPFPVLVEIGFVPVKPGATVQRIRGRHNSSIRPSYTHPPRRTPWDLRGATISYVSKSCFTVLLLAICAFAEPPKLRLGDDVRPVRYRLDLTVIPQQDTFTGKIEIDMDVRKPTDVVWLNDGEERRVGKECRSR